MWLQIALSLQAAVILIGLTIYIGRVSASALKLCGLVPSAYSHQIYLIPFPPNPIIFHPTREVRLCRVYYTTGDRIVWVLYR